jgi:Protein of unknown function (DUF2806)
VRTAANLDKAAARLILAKAEQHAARIDATTAHIKHQSSVEGRFLESAERITERALKAHEIPREIAFAYLEAQTQIKFSNRAKVLEEAVKQLTFHPPQQDTDKTIDDDWLNMFSRIAEEKSTEELQSLFGKILAGEIREPGAINLRTLTVVSTLTRNEANKIVEIFKYVIDQRFISSLQNLTGLDNASVNMLDEMGIIRGVGVHLSTSYNLKPHEQGILWGIKNGIRIKNTTDSILTVTTSANFLTEAGKQLYKIAKVDDCPVDYLRAVALGTAHGKTSLGIDIQEYRLIGKAEIALVSNEDDLISIIEKVLPAEEAS